jgi:putative SOS response-associated peptidase YedK
MFAFNSNTRLGSPSLVASHENSAVFSWILVAGVRPAGYYQDQGWRGPWTRAQRCLMSAGGFYESHLDEAGRKNPFFIHLADQDDFAFAGLCDRSYKDDGTPVESCAMITIPRQRAHASGSLISPIIARARLGDGAEIKALYLQ